VKRDIFKNHWQLSRRIACGQTLKDFTTDPQGSDRPTSFSCDLTHSKAFKTDLQGTQVDPQRPIVPHLSFSLFHFSIVRTSTAIVSQLTEYRKHDWKQDETRVPIQNSDRSGRSVLRNIFLDYTKILQSTVCNYCYSKTVVLHWFSYRPISKHTELCLRPFLLYQAHPLLVQQQDT
jgi:hypothetical protein